MENEWGCALRAFTSLMAVVAFLILRTNHAKIFYFLADHTDIAFICMVQLGGGILHV